MASKRRAKSGALALKVGLVCAIATAVVCLIVVAVMQQTLGAAITAVGAAAFVVSLPFTIMGGAVSESAETLVLGPAEATFVRCLGCLVSGYSYKDMERRRERRERAAAMADGR